VSKKVNFLSRTYRDLQAAKDCLDNTINLDHVTNFNYSMYQFPSSGKIFGIKYTPSISYDGKIIEIVDLEKKKLVVPFCKRKENALFNLVTKVNKDYNILIDADIVRPVYFWCVMGELTDSYIILFAINWDGLWIRPDHFRDFKKTSTRDIDELNYEGIYYLNQFKSPEDVNLNTPYTHSVRLDYFLGNDLLSEIIEEKRKKNGDSALILPESPYLFQRTETWFVIKSH
jgi:hypothetical protein